MPILLFQVINFIIPYRHYIKAPLLSQRFISVGAVQEQQQQY